MKQTILALALIFSLSSCSAMRLRYEAEVTAEGGPKTFKYERSYDVGGGIPAFCGISAIFLGGACWYYLVMPTVPEKDRLRADAEGELKKTLAGQPYTVKELKIEQVNWANEPVVSQLE